MSTRNRTKSLFLFHFSFMSTQSATSKIIINSYTTLTMRCHYPDQNDEHVLEEITRAMKYLGILPLLKKEPFDESKKSK